MSDRAAGGRSKLFFADPDGVELEVVYASALAWLAWSVVVTNVAENIGLFVTLTSGPSDPWPLVIAAAHYWAGIVIALCLLFSAAGVLARVRRAHLSHRGARRPP